MKDILNDKRKQKDLDSNNVLEKNEGQNQSIIRSLSKIWTAVSQPGYLKRIQWTLI